MERKSARCSKGDVFRISIVLTLPGLLLAVNAAEIYDDLSVVRRYLARGARAKLERLEY